MSKYICSNRRCKCEFHSSENTPTIRCPSCDTELLNAEKVINTDNLLWIESMFKNIQTYGKTETFNMIDRVYSNPIVRARVRKIFFETLEILGKNI